MDENKFKAVKELISFAYVHAGEMLEADDWNKMSVKDVFYPIGGRWKVDIIPEGFLKVVFYKTDAGGKEEIFRTETIKFPK